MIVPHRPLVEIEQVGADHAHAVDDAEERRHHRIQLAVRHGVSPAHELQGGHAPGCRSRGSAGRPASSGRPDAADSAQEVLAHGASIRAQDRLPLREHAASAVTFMGSSSR